MDSTAERRPRLPKLLVESLVIVGSILAAFGIDAAWEERNEREQEKALLESLIADFEAARRDLQRVLPIHERIIGAAEQLTLPDRASIAAAHVDSLRQAVAYLLLDPTFDPPSGTVAAVLSSGRIDIIKNRELVLELTQWSAVAQDFQEDEDRANGHLDSTLYPMLLSSFNLKDVVPKDFIEFPALQREVGSFDVLLEDSVQSMLFRHWAYHMNATRSSAPLVLEAIDRVLRLLEESPA